MMDIDITLEQLPEHILKEIFELTTKISNLRLVCKTFKRIIDNSLRLLKNEWLSVDKTLTLNSSNIHYPYQNLVLQTLGAMELYWMSKYKHKDRIKAIRITSGDRCPTILQYIISNFNSLEVLDFDMDRFYDEKFFNPLNSKLVPNEQSKLRTLCIGYYQNKQCNILDMFADIPTIKNLYIHDFDILIFPRIVQWKLEKLMITDRDKYGLSMEIDDYSCKQFLLSQQATLKELRFHDPSDYISYIMRTLPNLQKLSLSLIEEYGGINDEFTISNLQLQQFSLTDICVDELPVLETLLRHYKNVKRLCLISDYSRKELVTYKPIEEMKFLNITQMILRSSTCMLVLKANVPNLKILCLKSISGTGLYNLTEIPNENMKNVEKLSFEECGSEDILKIVKKCPKLSHLNLSESYGDKKSFICIIKEILAVAPRVKHLGINPLTLNKLEKLRNQITDKRIAVKMHNSFRSMISEDWGREFADLLFLW